MKKQLLPIIIILLIVGIGIAKKSKMPAGLHHASLSDYPDTLSAEQVLGTWLLDPARMEDKKLKKDGHIRQFTLKENNVAVVAYMVENETYYYKGSWSIASDKQFGTEHFNISISRDLILNYNRSENDYHSMYYQAKELDGELILGVNECYYSRMQ